MLPHTHMNACTQTYTHVNIHKEHNPRTQPGRIKNFQNINKTIKGCESDAIRLALPLSFFLDLQGRRKPTQGKVVGGRAKTGGTGQRALSCVFCLGSTLSLKKWCVGELSFPLNFKLKSERGIVAADNSYQTNKENKFAKKK